MTLCIALRNNMTMNTLLNYLKKNGIDQSTFASKVGCNQSHISLICKGARRPSPELALKIQEATGGRITVLALLYPTNSTLNKQVTHGK